MPNIFDEGRMMELLSECVPENERIYAGVHGVTLQVNQKRTSKFDVYVGVTQRYLLVAECEGRQYLDQFYHIPDLRKTVAEDVGTCFPLAEIQSCVIQSAIMGAVNCAITLKDGSFLKIQLPKRGGLGGGMPRHAEYREQIIGRLSSLNCSHSAAAR